jgi:hypothetical protein
MKKIICLVLVLTLCLSLAACGQNPSGTETTQPAYTQTQPTVEQTQPSKPKELTAEEKILAERRDAVERYMREMTTVRWKSDVDISYALAQTGGTLHIKAGRIYQGLPYSFAASTTDSFLEYAGEPDENGVYTISGLQPDALSGGGTVLELGEHKNARIGNACSSAVMLAWSQISDSFTARSSFQMFQAYGVYPVGDYVLDIQGENIGNTAEVILKNGREKIYECYAQLQKGDAIVKQTGGDHTALVVGVNVVYREDGTIDPLKSSITKLEQTRSLQAEQPAAEEVDPNKIYPIGVVDSGYTFKAAAQAGYIPVTIRELQDASYTPAEPTITDTQTEFNKDTILAGTISCNWMFDRITMTITDETGAEVQKVTARTDRYSMKDFVMERFVTDLPSTLIGSLDLNALKTGNYHCTVVCRLTNGQEVTARDFNFSV